jgi:hypothetical protein
MRNGLEAGAVGEAGTKAGREASAWSRTYSAKYRFQRITEFPAGIAAPRKVRIYWRHDHYLVQWWSPPQGKNVCERIAGDLLSALVRAREVDQRLENFPRTPAVAGRCGHAALAERFLDHLGRRAEAGEVQPATVVRYRTALGHYLAFADQAVVQKAYRHTHQIDRDFRLAFAAFLANRQVAPNGRPQAEARPMRGQAFVLDAVRAMLEWAADPDRGHLLPEGFRNPFLRQGQARPLLRGDPLAEPDITLAMALDLVRACDRHQLLLFAPMLLFGLRASEPCYLFREYLEGGWLRVPCNGDLGYRTKAGRDKRFPLPDELRPLWDALRTGGDTGLLYQRRSVAEGREVAPLRGQPLAALVTEYRRRCAAAGSPDAAGRELLRDALLREAGGLGYDHVEQEFGTLARRLGWPSAATLKDLRHLFATTLGNTPMPEGYRRYLMGQSPGKAAVVAYTHLNQLREQYAEVVRGAWAPLADAVARRLADFL